MKKRKKRGAQIFYCGMSILAALFIIVGLVSAVRGGRGSILATAMSVSDQKKAQEAGRKAAEEGAARDAERKAAEEAAQKAKEEAERKAKEEAERKAKEEAEKAKREAERKAKEEAEKKAEEAAAEAESKTIRVLLMTDGFRGTVHPKAVFSADSGLVFTYGGGEKSYSAGEKITVTPNNPWFQQGNVRVRAKEGKVRVDSISRGDGTPAYAGSIELYRTAEGLVLINELSVESYLCGVVPSEMPASYELEALKAQAVCARSYAYRQMENYGYPEYKAHVNDSTDYQVYNNSAQDERASQAVKETAGQAVRYHGDVVSTYYYSTSSGTTTNMEAWGTKPNGSNGYLQSVKVKGENGDYEKNLPWYRWTVKVSVGTLSNLIGLNTGKDVGTLKSVEITKRGPGNVALAMKAVGSRGSVTVETENKIRSALGGSSYDIVLNDGSTTGGRDLLPSAFFTIEKSGDQFVIKGGGFGHGIGMSQTGANEMAKQGKDYREILSLFYSDITVE